MQCHPIHSTHGVCPVIPDTRPHKVVANLKLVVSVACVSEMCLTSDVVESALLQHISKLRQRGALVDSVLSDGSIIQKI